MKVKRELKKQEEYFTLLCIECCESLPYLDPLKKKWIYIGSGSMKKNFTHKETGCSFWSLEFLHYIFGNKFFFFFNCNFFPASESQKVLIQDLETDSVRFALLIADLPIYSSGLRRSEMSKPVSSYTSLGKRK
jgi:hypothetical protein